MSDSQAEHAMAQSHRREDTYTSVNASTLEELLACTERYSGELPRSEICLAVKRLALSVKVNGITGDAQSKSPALFERLTSAVLKDVDSEADRMMCVPLETLVDLAYLDAASGCQLSDAQVTAFVQQLDQQFLQIPPQDMCTLIWSLAQIHPHEGSCLRDFLQRLSGEMVNALHDNRSRLKLSPEDISNLATGYAKCTDVPDPAMLVAIAKTAQRILPEFSPEGLADLIWAFAQMIGQAAVPPPEVAMLVERIPGEVLHQLMHNSPNAKAQPTAVCKLLWSYATLNSVPKKLMTSLASDIQKRLSEYALEDVVKVSWAYAHLEQYPKGGLMEGMTDVLEMSLGSLSVGQAATMLWASAVQRHHPGTRLLSRIHSKLARGYRSMRPQELGAALWAFAQLSFADALPLLEDGVALARTWLRDYSVQDVWHIAWAAAVFERLTVEDVALLAGKHTDMQIANYPSRALQGVAEVALLLGERGAACFPGGLLNAARSECRRLLSQFPPNQGTKGTSRCCCKHGPASRARPCGSRRPAADRCGTAGDLYCAGLGACLQLH
eukprot:jgi/Botrbrau1/10403/Bobra.0133s0012.1